MICVIVGELLVDMVVIVVADLVDVLVGRINICEGLVVIVAKVDAYAVEIAVAWGANCVVDLSTEA